jgi:cation transport regulator
MPAHAQDIYREAFNHAFASRRSDPRQEEIAHRTAWAAVKRSYVKSGGDWVPLEHQFLIGQSHAELIAEDLRGGEAGAKRPGLCQHDRIDHGTETGNLWPSSGPRVHDGGR